METHRKDEIVIAKAIASVDLIVKVAVNEPPALRIMKIIIEEGAVAVVAVAATTIGHKIIKDDSS